MPDLKQITESEQTEIRSIMTNLENAASILQGILTLGVVSDLDIERLLEYQNCYGVMLFAQADFTHMLGQVNRGECRICGNADPWCDCSDESPNA